MPVKDWPDRPEFNPPQQTKQNVVDTEDEGNGSSEDNNSEEIVAKRPVRSKGMSGHGRLNIIKFVVLPKFSLTRTGV